jgi:hypothetical protein
MECGQSSIRKIANLSDLIDSIPQIDITAIDAPIGLLDIYQVGGRECDRLARRRLRQARGRSVFPAPPGASWRRLICLPCPVADRDRDRCLHDQCRLRHEAGQVGKRADLVVLDRDTLTVDPDSIEDTKVLATYLDGRLVYSAQPGSKAEDAKEDEEIGRWWDQREARMREWLHTD